MVFLQTQTETLYTHGIEAKLCPCVWGVGIMGSVRISRLFEAHAQNQIHHKSSLLRMAMKELSCCFIRCETSGTDCCPLWHRHRSRVGRSPTRRRWFRFLVTEGPGSRSQG